MQEISIAIIGAGFWGRNHARVLREIPGVNITHICDIIPERAKEVALRYNIPNYVTDYRKVMLDDVDGIIISTTSTTHAEIAISAIENGKHVLIEKPMATTMKQAEEIVLSARRNRCIVMVGFIERFNPAVVHGKKLIDNGEIGNITLSFSRRIGSWPERVGDVGVVKDTAIHDIDLSMYIFNELPISVYARGGSIRHRLEDHVQAVLSYEGGKSAMIEANWLTPKKKREMHITGDRGVISIHFLTRELIVEKEDGMVIPMIGQEEPLMVEDKHFIESIRKKRTPIVNEMDGLRSLLVADAILESMKTGKVIHLDEYACKELTINL